MNIIIAGCPCHTLHNTLRKASNPFNNISGFEISDRCVDLSSKRKGVLKEYYDFCDFEYVHVIKLISTCWLCLEICVNRELNKYSGLKCYFQSESFADERFKRLQTSFNDLMTEVYLLFHQTVLLCFTSFNKLFQSEEPLINCMTRNNV